MSIKGINYDWYVGKTRSSLITWSGKKISFNYYELKQITYHFANQGNIGDVCFFKKTDESIHFKFKKKYNDSVLRAIELIKDYNADLIIKKSEIFEKTKTCLYCKTEIPKDANFCPHCARRQGTGRVSTIIFVVVFFSFIYLFTKDNNNVSLPTSNSSKNILDTKSLQNESENVEETDQIIYEVGDVFESDKLKIMFLDSGDYESDNMFMQPESGNKFIFVEFSIENVSDSDRSVGSFDFDCYADDTECTFALSGIEDAMTTITTLSPGRYVKGKICYEVPKNANNIEIEFETSFWTQDKIYFVVK